MEDIRAVRLYVFVQPQTRRCAREQASERCLAHRERVSPHVLTVKLDQVKAIKEHACVVAPIADAVKGCDAVLAASNRLPINDAGPRAQLGQCLDNERKPIGQVIARTAVELYPIAGFASNNPEAIVLNLVEPCLARGRSWGSRWEARPNETCRIKKL